MFDGIDPNRVAPTPRSRPRSRGDEDREMKEQFEQCRELARNVKIPPRDTKLPKYRKNSTLEEGMSWLAKAKAVFSLRVSKDGYAERYFSIGVKAANFALDDWLNSDAHGRAAFRCTEGPGLSYSEGHLEPIEQILRGELDEAVPGGQPFRYAAAGRSGSGPGHRRGINT